MFIPPRCPSTDCVAHRNPERVHDGVFYFHNGEYHPKCRPHPVPRFRCRGCGKGFSRQTFRMDYCDNKPHRNAMLFKLLASGLGLRQSARLIYLTRRNTELKARKIQRHLGRVHRNLTDQFGPRSKFMLDEMETFEGERGVLPVTVPMLIESNSLFVIACDVAPIKPAGQMSRERREAIGRAERRLGPRRDGSKSALQRTFRRMKFFCKDVPVPQFTSDKKHLYARLLQDYFGAEAASIHVKISSKKKRDQLNPLKSINLTNAMARDLTGRLRRESWLVSKARRYLRLQLHVFAAYRNFIRRRTNREEETPAQVLGFLNKRATFEGLLSWRQDWRWLSIHPLARRPTSIECVRGRASAAA